MDLCYSHSKIPLSLSATRKYRWELIRDMCKRATPPFFLRVEGTYIPLPDEDSLTLGCKVSSAYHDWLAYNAPEDDDGLEEDAHGTRRRQD